MTEAVVFFFFFFYLLKNLNTNGTVISHLYTFNNTFKWQKLEREPSTRMCGQKKKRNAFRTPSLMFVLCVHHTRAVHQTCTFTNSNPIRIFCEFNFHNFYILSYFFAYLFDVTKKLCIFWVLSKSVTRIRRVGEWKRKKSSNESFESMLYCMKKF